MKGLWELPPHSLLVTPFVKNAPLMAYSLVQFVGGGIWIRLSWGYSKWDTSLPRTGRLSLTSKGLLSPER